jgi:hypothetical protein
MDNTHNSFITYFIYMNTSALKRLLIDKMYRNEYYTEVNSYKLSEINLKDNKFIEIRNKLLSSKNLPSVTYIISDLLKSNDNKELTIITEESIKIVLQVVCLISTMFCAYMTKKMTFDYKYSKNISKSFRFSFRFSILFAVFTNTFNIFMTSFYKNKHLFEIQDEYEMEIRKYKKLLDNKL